MMFSRKNKVISGIVKMIAGKFPDSEKKDKLDIDSMKKIVSDAITGRDNAVSNRAFVAYLKSLSELDKGEK